MSLRCRSPLAFDEFVLYKEEHTQHSQQLDEGMEAGSHYVQAVFSMGPITPARAGTYRCYGSFNHSPYEWSAPSDPLDIVITGECDWTVRGPLGPWELHVMRLFNQTSVEEEK